MDLKKIGIGGALGFIGNKDQAEKASQKKEEEKRRRGKRIMGRKKSSLWLPGQQEKPEIDLNWSLQDFAANHRDLFDLAIRAATYAIEQKMTDISMKIPITIGAQESEVSGEGIFLFLQVHLDHDLLGMGHIRILSDEEIFIEFPGSHRFPKFVAESETQLFEHLISLAEERNHHLDIIREMITDPVESSDLEGIEDRLERMLEEYYQSTAPILKELLPQMEAKGAWCSVNGEVLEVKADEPGIIRLLTQTGFQFPASVEDDDPVFPLLESYRSAEFKKGGYLRRAIKDITLCGLTVVTERSFDGQHRSTKLMSCEGELRYINVPNLAYATKITLSTDNSEVVEEKAD